MARKVHKVGSICNNKPLPNTSRTFEMDKASRQLAEGRTIDGFLAALSRGCQIFTLQKGEGGQYHLVRADSWDTDRHTLGAFRSIEPLKSVLFQPREFLGSTLENAEAKPIGERIVIGVKNCDLAGLKIQDHVFLGLTPGRSELCRSS